MTQSRNSRLWSSLALGGLIAGAVAAIPFPHETIVHAQQPAKQSVSNGLQYVPTDAALFLYADADKIWNHDIVKNVRKADAETVTMLTGLLKSQLGIAPEDVKSLVFFIPKLKTPADSESFAVVITFAKPFDKKKLQSGVESLLPPSSKLTVITPDARTAILLMNLSAADYGQPQPANKGPLTDMLNAAASGKFAAVGGGTMANLPDEIRGDMIPDQLIPFKPVFNAVSVGATVDLAKEPTLDVWVKTRTAAQAGECERALAVFLDMMQKELIEEALEEYEPRAKMDAKLMELITIIKAASAAMKGAKFKTLGNETRMTLRLPADLPYTNAYLALRKQVDEASGIQKSANNMKQIGLALHNYHDTNGFFPPAAVCDKTGKPLLSWRVLILPYIEQDNLYKQFKLDEPWDSEHNKKLLAHVPQVYALPGAKKGTTDTHYRVFVGNGAAWDWLMGGRFQNIADGTSNTFAVVTAAKGVPWSKPDELEFDPKKDMTELMGLVVNGKAQVTMFDGSVRTLSKLPDKKILNLLIQQNDGQPVPDF